MREISFAGMPRRSAAWRKAFLPGGQGLVDGARGPSPAQFVDVLGETFHGHRLAAFQKRFQRVPVGLSGEFSARLDLEDGLGEVGPRSGRCGHFWVRISHKMPYVYYADKLCKIGFNTS